MRFKFRAWDTKLKQWLEEIPYLEYLLDDPKAAVSHHDMDDFDAIYFPVESPFPTDHEGRIVYQQWTGLFDDNGIEIYEGDLLQYSVMGRPVVTPIKYLGNGFWLEEPDGTHHLPNNRLVVGNIFENKST